MVSLTGTAKVIGIILFSLLIAYGFKYLVDNELIRVLYVVGLFIVWFIGVIVISNIDN